jgi:hypothetical protein
MTQVNWVAAYEMQGTPSQRMPETDARLTIAA